MDMLKKVWGYWWGKVVFVVVVMVAVSWVLAVVDRKATAEQVAKIHATRLTMDDVMGKNLPPDPGAEVDKTIAGIDANKNGIRDDVELAIFKEYPDSAKTRAALLQYALALQMEMVQLVVNRETVTEIVREQSRSYVCIGDVVLEKDIQKAYDEMSSLSGFVKTRQFNTQERKVTRESFLKNVRSYSQLEQKCDIDLSALPN